MFELKMNTKNAAFENCEAEETIRILKEVILKLESGREGGILHDINGNNVGFFKLTNR